MALLGVNIDHVATVRQARRTDEPDPVWAAVEAELGGADGITFHLREDRRHINARDARLLRETVGVKLNMEMAIAEEVVASAVGLKPDQSTLVPERREELTTEGGLDVVRHRARVETPVGPLREAALKALTDAVAIGRRLGLDVHGGHGLTYRNIGPVASLPGFGEFNIGHSIVSRAVFVGMREAG